MHIPRPESYEGNEPYIFISYAHRDSEIMYPILATLSEKGYRIWYDEGIEPGAEWTDDIANHIAHSAVILSFISPRSMESENCIREIKYATDKKIPFLYVLLEPTAMPPGVELQISTKNGIKKYSYSTEEQFYNRLFSSKKLSVCCKKQTEQKTEKIKESKEETTTIAKTVKNKKQPTTKKINKTIITLAFLTVVVITGVLFLSKTDIFNKKTYIVHYSDASEIRLVDPALVGKWDIADKDNEGTSSTPGMPNIYILPDGSIFSKSDNELRINQQLSSKKELIKFTTEDDKTTLVNTIWSAKSTSNTSLNNYIVTEKYEIFDCPATADDSYGKFRKDNTQDGLKIHVTGFYSGNALENKSVDITYTFLKCPNDYTFFAGLMCGKWRDQNENIWSFYFNKKYECYYTLKEVSGVVHNSKYPLLMSDSDTQFIFNDFSSPRYTLVSFDYNTIKLTSTEGSLILNRVYEN